MSTMEAYLDQFRNGGYVVLENILSVDRTAEALRLCECTSRRRNRVLVPVPYELLHRWPLKGIVRESIVWELLIQILGDSPFTEDFCWFRISPPGGSSIDRIHRDCRTQEGTLPSVSVDLMLTDFTAENGATEIWAGSQLTFDVDPAVAENIEEHLSPNPDRIIGSAGSVILRDQRAWHRGGFNRTDMPRCMFSSIGWRAT